MQVFKKVVLICLVILVWWWAFPVFAQQERSVSVLPSCLGYQNTAGAFPPSVPIPSPGKRWWETMRDVDNLLLFDREAHTNGKTSGVVLSTECFPGGWWIGGGINAAGVTAELNNTYYGNRRILDLDLYWHNDHYEFLTVLVPNDGPSAKAWWWYHGQSGDELSSLLRNGIKDPDHFGDSVPVRMYDIERYYVGGKWVFAAVMLANTGVDNKAWLWGGGKSLDFLMEAFKTYGKSWRLVDVEISKDKLFSYILVLNEGEDARKWWWYYDKSWAKIQEIAANRNARIVDIEWQDAKVDAQNASGNWAAIMVENRREIRRPPEIKRPIPRPPKP